MDLSPPLADLVARQDGILTRQQLLAHGLTVDTWRWNAGRSWQVVLPRTVLVHREALTPRRRLIAAQLWAGRQAALSGPTAARLHGISSADPRGHVDLVTTRARSDRRSGYARVRRTALHDEGVVERGVLRLSSPARSAVDAAVAARTRGDAAAIIVEAAQRRLATLDDIAEWVHRVRPDRRTGVSAALEDAARGVWSRPEAELLDILAHSDLLPEPMANPVLVDGHGAALVSPDVWFDEVALAVMVHSHRHHSQGDDWDETVDLDGGLTAAGVTVLGVTPRRVRTQPDRVLRRVEQAYRIAAARPRPNVTATPRDPWHRW